MCTPCRNNGEYTRQLEALLPEISKRKALYESAQAKHDEYNKTAGPMDFDFDCCDYSYLQLYETIWRALQYLEIAPQSSLKLSGVQEQSATSD